MEGIPPSFGFEKIECMMEGLRDYVKFIKRGYGRTNHLMNLEIRNKRVSRDEAINLVKQYDGKRPASLDNFLKWMDIDEEEFMEIAVSHCIEPHKHDPSRVGKGAPQWDQNLWNEMV